MRRAAPPPTLRVDPQDAGPWTEVTTSGRGLGLAPVGAPDGEVRADDRALRPTRGMPYTAHRAAVVNGGTVLITVSPGLARTYRMPDMVEIFDRRPPGLSDVRGATLANAALLRDDAGWRAVVLPSMGDLAADLGPGPIAIRGDGRRVAVVHEGALFEVEIPGAATAPVETAAPVDAIAFASDGALVVAHGAGLGTAQDGSPVVEMAAAASAPRVLTRHADGGFRLWDADSRTELARWTSSLDAVDAVALDASGERAALCGVEGDVPVSVVVSAADGVPMRSIRGARTIAFTPKDTSLVVGGDWGIMLMEPPRENS